MNSYISAKYKNGNDNVTENNSSNDLGSRRQKFFNLMKTTRDTYLPTIQQKTMESIRSTRDTINNYAASNSGELFNPTPNDNNITAQTNLPPNISIEYFPTYTTVAHVSENGPKEYETVVRFSITTPGDLTSMKNKLLLSICKQYLKPSTSNDMETDDVDTTFLEQKINEIQMNDDVSLSPMQNSPKPLVSHTSTSLSINSSPSITSSMRREGNTLTERISGFVSKKIMEVPTIIDLFSTDLTENDFSHNFGNLEKHTSYTTTDNNGFASIKIKSNFEPHSIRIALDSPTGYEGDKFSEIFPTKLINNSGIGIISDIDDTIKHTGVTGDKRSMFRNVFVQNEDFWLIEGVPEWYNSLCEIFKTDFFYVSNSPMQLYPVLDKYINDYFPNGPIFLKQYSGNIISSIMSPVSNGKLDRITNILQDFPNKKFILIGDSGEKDFETYISTALQFPTQVLGIFIRCCKNSMSDFGLREYESKEEIMSIIQKKYNTTSTANNTLLQKQRRRPPPPIAKKKPILNEGQEDSIMKSRQNMSTAIWNDAYSVKETATSSTAPPVLPPRPTNFREMPFEINSDPDIKPSTDIFYDGKAENWKARVEDGIFRLKANGNDKLGLSLTFFTDPESCFEETALLINKHGNN